MQIQRRRLLAAGCAGTFVGAAGALLGAAALAQPAGRVIRVLAKKFEFTPAEIALVKGEPVVFELTAEDVTMGFYLPDYKIGVEIVPGKPVRLPFVPDRAGTFEFICDVFCGDGHEDMGGKLVVTA